MNGVAGWSKGFSHTQRDIALPSFCHKFQLLFYPYAEGYCFKILQDFPSDIVLPIRKGISRAPMCVSLSGTWFLHAQRISLQKFSAISIWDTRPLRRGRYPAAIFQQSRAEVSPNSYARGDHIRPYYYRATVVETGTLVQRENEPHPWEDFSHTQGMPLL